VLEFEPDGLDRGFEKGLKGFSRLADFAHQYAVLGEMITGLAEQAADQIQAIQPRSEPEFRLVAEFSRQAGHRCTRHVRRIGQDEVVSPPGEPIEQIRLQALDAIGDTMAVGIASSQRECRGTDIQGIDADLGPVVSQGNGQTAGAGSDIHRPLETIRFEPRFEIRHDELGQGRARHEDILVDLERQTGQPGLAEQISQRFARADPRLRQGIDARLLLTRQLARKRLGGKIGVKADRARHEPAGLIESIGGAMSEDQIRRRHALGDLADLVLQFHPPSLPRRRRIRCGSGARYHREATGLGYTVRMSFEPGIDRQRGRLFLIVITLVLATAAGLIAASQMMQRAGEWRAAQLFPTPRPIADFRLETAAGDEFRLADLEGQWSLLFFGFTNCPDICPDTLAMLARSMNQLELMRREEKPQVVFVSVDPERDRGELLGEYVGWFDDDFVAVSGEDRQIAALTRQLGIAYFREAPDEATGFYNVDHSASVLIIDPEGRLYGRFAHPLDPELVTADLFRLTAL